MWILNFATTVLFAVLSQAVKRGKELGVDVVLCDTSGRKYRNFRASCFEFLMNYLTGCILALGFMLCSQVYTLITA